MKNNMRIFGIVLLAAVFLPAPVAAKEVPILTDVFGSSEGPTRQKVEDLDGRDVVVRLYDNWKKSPASFEKVYVELDGHSVRIDSNEIADSTVVVVLGEDQQDPAVRKTLGDCVYAQPYKKGLQFSLLRYDFSGRKHFLWTFTDALGIPIPQATVEIFLYMYKGPRVLIKKAVLDEQGRLKMPFVRGRLNQFSFLVSHPDYGIAEAAPLLRDRTSIEVSLVRRGTLAGERAIRGTIVDPEGKLVSGAKIRCYNVRTLGEGLINSSNERCKVISDEVGAFSLYMPNRKWRDERGYLIPPRSKYHIRIEAPKAFGLLPYVGAVVNGRETTITMERGGYFQRFVFEDENGRITDPNRLKEINLVIDVQGKGRLNFGYSDWKDGGIFPLGTYQAEMNYGRGDEFQPIEVTASSPEELVFTLPEGIVYYGQVVHGLTGEPLPGAFVMGMGGSGRGNLSMVTAEQWEALHALSANPSADHEALASLRKMYSFKKIVRTDEDGRFQMSFRPGGEFYGFVAFEENYLGLLRRKHALKPDENRIAEVPVMRLFPAAKVIVEPCVEEKHVSICPKWIIDKNNNPTWVGDFLAVDDRKESLFTYNKWLKQNEVQTFHVPAGLNLRVQLRAPYDKQWCPITIEQNINLRQGEVIDLGRHTFKPALKVSVKVFNSAGEPVEGVPVRMLVGPNHWGVAHNTDEEGIARFHVVPYSQGEFGVSYYGDELRFRETVPYGVSGEEDTGREFTLWLSDEMLYQLFK